MEGGFDPASRSITSVTLNGSGMTQVGSIVRNASTDQAIHCWYMDDADVNWPATGNRDCVVTLNGLRTMEMAVFGVEDYNSITANSNGTGNSASPACSSMTSDTDELVIGGFCTYSANRSTLPSGYTNIYNGAHGASSSSLNVAEVGGASSIAFTLDYASAVDFAGFAITIDPVSTGVTITMSDAAQFSFSSPQGTVLTDERVVLSDAAQFAFTSPQGTVLVDTLITMDDAAQFSFTSPQGQVSVDTRVELDDAAQFSFVSPQGSVLTDELITMGDAAQFTFTSPQGSVTAGGDILITLDDAAQFDFQSPQGSVLQDERIILSDAAQITWQSPNGLAYVGAPPDSGTGMTASINSQTVVDPINEETT